MNLNGDALEFIQKVRRWYFEERNMDAFIQIMDSDITSILTGSHKVCRGIRETALKLYLEKEQFPEALTIVDESYDIQQITEQVWKVTGRLLAAGADAPETVNEFCISAVCVNTAAGMQLNHIHISDQSAAKELRIRNRELEALMNSAPGGVCQYRPDEDFTLTSISASFCELVGYTGQEIAGRFQNRCIELIYEEDRDRVRAEAEAHIKTDKLLEFEYRIRCKDGSLKWVLDRGKLTRVDKEEVVCCIIVDITNRKETEENLRLSLERHQVIMDQSTDIIFEWDLVGDTLTYSPNWTRKFGYDPNRKQFSKKMKQSKHINTEDRAKLARLMEQISDGVDSGEIEIRLFDACGQEIWCRLRAVCQHREDGKPVRVVGILTDIDGEKKEQERLREIAQKDPLTGIYNKAAIQSLVQKKMKQQEQLPGYHVLMIIDLDNFKPVNDTYGHLCGDSLLTEVADVLKRLFRTSDYVGRIGGDEFLVYLPRIRDRESAAHRAEHIREELGMIRPNQGADGVSCSIGLDFASHQKADYLEMFRDADIALYRAKENGKGKMEFYK